MGGDDYCLKWNDHHSIFFNSVEQLCRGEVLTDVTLSCGSTDFKAHKLVLSVSSGYFARLFANTTKNQGNAIVYLKDVEPGHMELLLRYMYKGEINIEESELVSLLATAKGLQIKGLTETNDDPVPPPPVTPISQPPTEKPSHSQSVAPVKRRTNSDEFASAKRIKEEALTMEENLSEDISENDLDQSENTFAGDQIQNLEEGYPVPEGGGPYIYEEGDDTQPVGPGPLEALMCLSSSVGPPSRPDIKAPFQNKCYYCLRNFISKMDLKLHMDVANHTGEKPFLCVICEDRFTQNANLKAHVQLLHNIYL